MGGLKAALLLSSLGPLESPVCLLRLKDELRNEPSLECIRSSKSGLKANQHAAEKHMPASVIDHAKPVPAPPVFGSK